MLNIQNYSEKLKALGYSQDTINHIVALHISNGEIDVLEYYLSNDGVKK